MFCPNRARHDAGREAAHVILRALIIPGAVPPGLVCVPAAAGADPTIRRRCRAGSATCKSLRKTDSGSRPAMASPDRSPLRLERLAEVIKVRIAIDALRHANDPHLSDIRDLGRMGGTAGRRSDISLCYYSRPPGYLRFPPVSKTDSLRNQ